MTLETEITKLQTNLSNSYSAAEAKGATLPEHQNFDNLADTIGSISGGGGEQVEAVNRTGTAITSGDKVWINQENGENKLVNLYNNTPNYIVNGTPTFDSSGKVVSGFSTTNELQLLDRKKYSTGGINSIEMVFKIHTPTEGNWTDSGRIINSRERNDDFALTIAPTFAGFRFLEADSSSDKVVRVAPDNMLSDTDYWIKVTYDGINLYGYYSLDGEIYTLQETNEHSSNDLYLNSTYGYSIGNRHLYSGYNNPVCVWNGSIDLSESYIKINNEIWWTPYETNVTADMQTGIAAENIASGSTGLINVGAVIEPTGTLSITENGTVDVKEYASAEVAVPQPELMDFFGITLGANTTLPYVADFTVYPQYAGTTSATFYAPENFSAENIKNGVKIMGVTGTYTGGTGGTEITVTNNTGATVSAGDKVWIESSGNNYNLIDFRSALYNNFTVIGSPTVNTSTGVVSGFSSSSYLTLSQSLNPANSPWEVKSKFTTSNDVNSAQGVFQTITAYSDNGQYGICLMIYQGKLDLSISTDGTSWLFDTRGTYTLSTNTTYWVKFGWTGTEYYLDYSTDGTNYIRDVTENSTTPAFSLSNYTLLGIYSWKVMDYFRGTLDLSETYIKVNNSIWWDPRAIQITADTLTGFAQENIAVNSSGSVKTLLPTNE